MACCKDGKWYVYKTKLKTEKTSTFNEIQSQGKHSSLNRLKLSGCILPSNFRLYCHLNIVLQAVLHLSTAALPRSFHVPPESQKLVKPACSSLLNILHCKNPCNKTVFPVSYYCQQEKRGNSWGTYSWFSQHGHSWSLLCLVHPDLPGSCIQGHHHHQLHLQRSRFWTVVTLPQHQAAARSRSSLFTAWPVAKRAGITAGNELCFFYESNIKPILLLNWAVRTLTYNNPYSEKLAWYSGIWVSAKFRKSQAV